MIRSVNQKILRDAIEQRGLLGKEMIAIETDLVTVASINRMLSSGKAPTRASRERLARVLKVSIDELFPVVEDRKKKTA